MLSVKKQNLSTFYLLSFYLLIIFSSKLLTIPINEHVHFLLLLIPILLVFYNLNWTVNKMSLFLILALFITLKIGLSFTLDPIVANDSVGYYNQTQTFSTLHEFWDYAKNHLGESSYIMFGLLYMPFYYLADINSPHFIVIFNTVFALLMVYIWSKLLNSHFNPPFHKSRYQKTVIYLLILSPSLIYYSSVFLKDIANTFFIILAVGLFLNKKNILSVLSIGYAYSFRPYAVIIGFLYYVYIKQKLHLAILGALFSLFFVYITAGSIALVNSFTNLGYLFFSPNPLELGNFQIRFLPTLESAFFMVCLLLILYKFISDKNSRRLITITFLLLLVYSCVLTLVGYYNLDEASYGFFMAGDDFSRKRFPMIFLINTTVGVLLFKKNKVLAIIE